jgi:dCMP deaminase
MDWDAYLMNLAKATALKSKDPSTKLGAIIVGPKHEIRATGFNSFPTGINDDVPERKVRPEKYKWVEHAERNAIYCAARHGASLEGCTLYCEWPPCTDCARAIIQVGIIKIIVNSFDIPKRWQLDMNTSITMLKEAKVKIQKLGDLEPTPWDEISL